MRTYLLATGVIFALIVVAHVWRIVSESHALAREPWFMALTLVAAAMSGWAFWLAARTPRANGRS